MTEVARETLWAMAREGRLAAVELRPTGKLLAPSEELAVVEKLVWERRLRQMAPFLDHEVVAFEDRTAKCPDLDAAGSAFDLDALARQVVEALAADPNRRMHRRLLLYGR